MASHAFPCAVRLYRGCQWQWPRWALANRNPHSGRQDGLISQGRASPGPDGLTCPHLAEITLNTLTGVHVAAATAHDCQLEYYDTRVVHMICVQPAHGMHNLNPVSTVARLARRHMPVQGGARRSLCTQVANEQGRACAAHWQVLRA